MKICALNRTRKFYNLSDLSVTVYGLNVTLDDSGKNGQMELQCLVDGYLPEVLDQKIFQWSKHGVQLHDGSKYRVFSNGSLLIRNVGEIRLHGSKQ